MAVVFMSCNQNERQENLTDFKIAYNVLEDAEKDNYEIYVMNTDGTDKKNISNWEGVDWVYYAHESKIYFLSDRDTCHRCAYYLYESDAEGNNVKKITNFPLKDSWLSSREKGTELIVTPKLKSDSAFYIIDLNGKVLQKIYTNLPSYNDPIFSPEGNQIVFCGGKVKTENGLKYINELYLMNVDGSGLKQLTHYPADDTTAEWYAYRAGPPIWESNRNIITYPSKQNGNYSIYSVNPDGSEVTQLTPDSTDETYHSWSPAGDWLVFDGIQEENNYDIFLMNFKSKEIKRLTNDEKYEQGPVFVEWKGY
jgi:TolB protein